MCGPRVAEGTLFSESPVCGRAVELVRVQALVVDEQILINGLVYGTGQVDIDVLDVRPVGLSC